MKVMTPNATRFFKHPASGRHTPSNASPTPRDMMEEEEEVEEEEEEEVEEPDCESRLRS